MPIARRNIMRFSSSLSRGGRPAGAGQEGVCVGFAVAPAAFPDEPPPLGLMGLMSMGGPRAVLVWDCVGVVVVSIFFLLLLLFCCVSFCFFLSGFGSRGDDSVGSSSC